MIDLLLSHVVGAGEPPLIQKPIGKVPAEAAAAAALWFENPSIALVLLQVQIFKGRV